MNINRMCEHHLDDVLSLEQRSFSHPWSRQGFVDELKKDSSYLFVAEKNDEVIGYCVMSTVLDEGSLLDICVDSNYRRQGVAKALFDKLSEVASILPLAFITLEVRASNIGAISLYSSLGFEKVAVRKAYYSKPVEDAVLMTRYF